MTRPRKQSPIDFGLEPCFKFETNNPERMFWLLQQRFSIEYEIKDELIKGYRFSAPYGNIKLFFSVGWDGVVWDLELIKSNGLPQRHVDNGDSHWLVRELDRISKVLHDLEHKAKSSSSRSKSE